MKQVFLNAQQRAEVVEVDLPPRGPREVMVAVGASLISTGTETAGYDSGGPISRGMRDPSVIRRVVDGIRGEGFDAMRRKIVAKGKEMLPLGYSGAGVVVAVGAEVRSMSPGDRVAYAGAPHAEYVAVNENLVAAVPEGVSLEAAAFGAIGCIALHGVRLGEPTLGETAVVVGLGLVGLAAAQCARASGLWVIGVEPIGTRRAVAQSLGFQVLLDPTAEENLGRTVLAATSGLGADIVYLCAGLPDSDVTNTALAYARDRARVVMIGDMGLDLNRSALFGKELNLRVSRSYGPGRYDPAYERRGHEYPIGYVRWTEGRNLAQIMTMLGDGSLVVDPMISARVPVDQAPEAYQRLVEAPERTLAVVLTYQAKPQEAPRPTPFRRTAATRKAGELRVGVIGAGSFVEANLLPHLPALNARLYAVANRTPAGFSRLEALYHPTMMTTDPAELLGDPEVDAVIIGTRHDSHPALALAAVAAGKAVHVEKPLALILEDAEKVAAAVAQGDTLLTVGFNRRFAPTVVALREAISSVTGPRQFLYRINAPLLPAGHWTADPVEGGGRLIGEGCHFIDLVCHLADSEVASVSGGFLGSCGPSAAQDNFSAVLRFQNGDLATVVYSGQGNPALPKERLEAFAGGKAFVLDDFLRLSAYGIRLTSSPPERPDKGFHQHLAHFFAAVRGEGSLVTTAQDWLRVARVIEALLNPGLPQ